MEHSAGAAVEPYQQIGVVLEDTPLDKGRDIGAEFLDLEAGDIFGEVFRVGSDVAQTVRRAGFRRIDAPERLLVTLALDFAGKPTLRILDDAIFRIFPSAPPRAISRASFTMG
jgi:hypothetical protein